MKKLLIRWIIAAVAIYIAGSIISGFSVLGWQSAFIAAIILGVLNFTIKPIVTILTLPITVLTLGLFLFVVNGITLYVLGMLLSGIEVTSLISAIFASVVISIVTMILSNVLGIKD
ncbi:MAG: phage holin family protein [Bacillota bacterium]|nr:phage holin family protein [Bacillota bacterium]